MIDDIFMRLSLVCRNIVWWKGEWRNRPTLDITLLEIGTNVFGFATRSRNRVRWEPRVFGWVQFGYAFDIYVDMLGRTPDS